MELRTGRTWALQAAKSGAANDPRLAESYAALTIELDGLRRAVTANVRDGNPSLANLLRDHKDPESALARAIALAFAAAAHGSPTPPGIVTWASEGLARCEEREFATFDAMDICALGATFRER